MRGKTYRSLEHCNIFIKYSNLININNLKSQFMSYMLSLKSKTWYKDSHSLYDYESDKITESTYEVQLPEEHVAIFRKKNSTFFSNLGNSVLITNKPETA